MCVSQNLGYLTSLRRMPASWPPNADGASIIETVGPLHNRDYLGDAFYNPSIIYTGSLFIDEQEPTNIRDMYLS